jgi:hypothetical protein
MEISGTSRPVGPVAASRVESSNVDSAPRPARAGDAQTAFQKQYQTDSFEAPSATRGARVARGAGATGEMSRLANDQQQLMDAAVQIQTQLGETQAVAQTAQQAAGGSKAAARPG